MRKSKTNLEVLKTIFGEGLPINPEAKRKIKKVAGRSNIRLAQKLNLPYPDVLARAKQKGGRLEMIKEAAERCMVAQDFRRRFCVSDLD